MSSTSDPVQIAAALSQLALAAVFGSSAVSKLAARGRFRDAVAGYGILPELAVAPAALVVVLIELMLALSFAVGFFPGVMASLAACLLAAFLVAVAVALRRGVRGPCGCFGSDEGISFRTVVRIALVSALLVPVIALLASGEGQSLRAWYAMVSAPTDVLQIGLLAALLVVMGTWLLRLDQVLRVASITFSRERDGLRTGSRYGGGGPA